MRVGKHKAYGGRKRHQSYRRSEGLIRNDLPEAGVAVNGSGKLQSFITKEGNVNSPIQRQLESVTHMKKEE